MLVSIPFFCPLTRNQKYSHQCNFSLLFIFSCPRRLFKGAILLTLSVLPRHITLIPLYPMKLSLEEDDDYAEQ